MGVAAVGIHLLAKATWHLYFTSVGGMEFLHGLKKYGSCSSSSFIHPCIPLPMKHREYTNYFFVVIAIYGRWTTGFRRNLEVNKIIMT